MARPFLGLLLLLSRPSKAAEFRVATFEADITVPVGHACMGGGIADAKVVLDPLYAKGFVFLGAGDPVVVVALDWCQANNRSYDRWREALAEAAGTVPARVMLATVHQHDAPIADLRAQELLDEVGLKGSICDPAFHEQAVRKTAAALRAALASPRRVTHVGVGQAVVERVASNRRIAADAFVHWDRTSSDTRFDAAAEGEADHFLKTISLWDGDQPVLAWSCYAVHPMSYYSRGEVSADFVGMARARRQVDDRTVFQVYFTGCAGDTTAGKYNDGRPGDRAALAERMYRATDAAWKATRRQPLTGSEFRSAELRLSVRDTGDFAEAAQRKTMADPAAPRWKRNCAALGLAWRERGDKPIDVPCLDLGPGVAQFAVMPAETFVGYQLLAQSRRPDSFVVVAGFGDGAPGYLPTAECWAEGYADSYCWTTADAAPRMAAALTAALGPQRPKGLVRETRLDVVKRELSPDFCWFHPRCAAIPGAAPGGKPAVVLTLQKHLKVSDHYSGLYVMRTDDSGATWSGPTQVPELDWVKEPDGSTRAVCDVTPGWHAPTKRLLALGAQVWYDAKGRQLDDASPTAYAVLDPASGKWSPWRTLRMPDEKKFKIARNGCGQWLVDPDGTLLVPVYFGPDPNGPTMATVVRCRFDGETLTYVEHGDELKLTSDVGRGLAEPSIVRFQDRYFLTVRSDARGYAASSPDGLHFEAGLRPWLFDDGTELGSYNTQQHWLASDAGLFLAYTRRGLGNDHVMRHRAPLLMARVDPKTLRVLRETERVLIPERGAPLGNFGAAQISADEWWVTDSEYIMSTRRDPRGADGSVFAARVWWTKD